jgi:outer membrane lipoprotein SlyB
MKSSTKSFLSGALFAAASALSIPSYALFDCKECGTVTDVKSVEIKGEASGAGAVIGGVAGGVLGHQIGSGRGNTAATVLGAAGGAYAGHQVEKNRNSKTEQHVVVKLNDGKTRTFKYKDPTSYKVGDKIKVVDGKLVRQ